MKDKGKRETRRVRQVEERFSMVMFGISQDEVTDADLALIMGSDPLVTAAVFNACDHLVVTITPKEGTTPDAVRRHRAHVRGTVSTLLYSIPNRKAAAEQLLAGRFVAEHPIKYD